MRLVVQVQPRKNVLDEAEYKICTVWLPPGRMIYEYDTLVDHIDQVDICPACQIYIMNWG